MSENGKKTTELLAQVNDAISAVLCGGQSYKIGSRALTRADLSMLKALREELEGEIGSGRSEGLLERSFVAFFDGR